MLVFSSSCALARNGGSEFIVKLFSIIIFSFQIENKQTKKKTTSRSTNSLAFVYCVALYLLLFNRKSYKVQKLIKNFFGGFFIQIYHSDGTNLRKEISTFPVPFPPHSPFSSSPLLPLPPPSSTCVMSGWMYG